MNNDNSNNALDVINLYKQYTNHDGKKVLDDINLSVSENEFICILGRSGCGKTTFLRSIAGLEDFEGTIKVHGKEVTTPNADRIMVFQNFDQLFPWKNIEQNIQYPLKINKKIKDKSTLKNISDKYLDMVGLTEYAKFYPHQLSGGMKQRIAIARALVIEPDIILMDEPFASLDAMTRRILQNELLSLVKKTNVTILFVTHNIQEALILSSRIIVMSQDGKVDCDIVNSLPKPVTPSIKGYGELWSTLAQSIGIETVN